MKKSSLDINLIDVEVKKGNNSKQKSENYWFCNSSKSLIKRFLKLSEVTFDNQFIFKLGNFSIDIIFHLI